VAFRNLAEMFLEVTARPVPDLLRAKRGEVWEPLSAAEFRRRVARVAFALERLGLRRGDCAALIADNSPEWASWSSRSIPR
jgi:long-chain acyl-CoA synthetase